MPTAPLLVTIDGPAGAGKSTVARRVADTFGLPLLDTGAIYRTLALAAHRSGVPWNDEAALVRLARDFPITFGPRKGVSPPTVLFAGEDVSAAIRTPELSQGASQVSAHPRVRAALLDIQRRLGAGGCVAEGRDMGTVVFPHASHKFFLTADLQIRAARRYRDDVTAVEAGGAPTLQQVVSDIEERDHRDSSRAAAPLVQAADAICIDSSHLSLEEVVVRIVDYVRGAALRQ